MYSEANEETFGFLFTNPNRLNSVSFKAAVYPKQNHTSFNSDWHTPAVKQKYHQRCLKSLFSGSRWESQALKESVWGEKVNFSLKLRACQGA